MFHEDKCDLCGDCLAECKYIDYDRKAAIAEFSALIEGRPTNILKECITCAACNEICPQDANPFDLICRTQEETNALEIPEAVIHAFDSMCKGENRSRGGRAENRRFLLALSDLACRARSRARYSMSSRISGVRTISATSGGCTWEC